MISSHWAFQLSLTPAKLIVTSCLKLKTWRSRDQNWKTASWMDFKDGRSLDETSQEMLTINETINVYQQKNFCPLLSRTPTWNLIFSLKITGSLEYWSSHHPLTDKGEHDAHQIEAWLKARVKNTLPICFSAFYHENFSVYAFLVQFWQKRSLKM